MEKIIYTVFDGKLHKWALHQFSPRSSYGPCEVCGEPMPGPLFHGLSTMRLESFDGEQDWCYTKLWTGGHAECVLSQVKGKLWGGE